MIARFHPHTARLAKQVKNAGFSLVEVMVSMVIGLLTMIIIMQSYAAFEGQKRTTASGSDTQESGLTALHAIETDVRMAGFGMITPNGLACTQMNYSFNGVSVIGASAVPLLPVMIAASGASDTITVTYSDSATGGNPTVLVGSMSDSNADLSVDLANGVGFNPDHDLMLIGTPGSGDPCTRLAYTSAPAPNNYLLYNPPTSVNTFPPNGYVANQSFVLNMGNFVRKMYGIEANDLYSNDVGPEGIWVKDNGVNATPNLHLASNIVNLQAQYGVAPTNTQVGKSSPAVSCWTDAIDRSADATAGDCRANWTSSGISAQDAARIKAIRIAIVARNSAPAVCDPNLAAPTAWPGSVSSPAPTIDLSADQKWRCYRYRVYQTTIPLRNIIWANI